MKKLALLFLLSSLSLTLGRSNGEAPQGAWLQDGVKWTSAPPDINPHLQSGGAAVLYFKGDQSFALIYCTVGRIPNQYMTISHGDPQTLYLGTWKFHGDRIAAEYRLVSRTVRIVGENLPGPIQRTTIKRSRGILIFEGKTFRRAPALDKDAAEVAYGIQSSSRGSFCLDLFR